MSTDDLQQEFTSELSELVHQYRASGLDGATIADKLVLYADVASSQDDARSETERFLTDADD
jgi:hypothetical protein